MHRLRRRSLNTDCCQSDINTSHVVQQSSHQAARSVACSLFGSNHLLSGCYSCIVRARNEKPMRYHMRHFTDAAPPHTWNGRTVFGSCCPHIVSLVPFKRCGARWQQMSADGGKTWTSASTFNRGLAKLRPEDITFGGG